MLGFRFDCEQGFNDGRPGLSPQVFLLPHGADEDRKERARVICDLRVGRVAEPSQLGDPMLAHLHEASVARLPSRRRPWNIEQFAVDVDSQMGQLNRYAALWSAL